VAYADDRYVYKISAMKKYDIADYIEINIKELALS
jgi:Holliday junction resolvase RusA-like endonuclease